MGKVEENPTIIIVKGIETTRLVSSREEKAKETRNLKETEIETLKKRLVKNHQRREKQ